MLVTRPASISRYDFRRPNKLNREHVRALEIVGETFARGFTTVLGTSLRTGVAIRMEEIGQLTYDEYVRELPSPTLLLVLDLPPLKGAGMFHVPSSLTMGIVERLLGGAGAGAAPLRAPTEIEMKIITAVLERVFDRLGQAFDAIFPVRPSLNRTETNPQFAQVTAPTDMVVVMNFSVTVDGVPSAVSLGIPFTTLQPLLEEATNRNRVDDAELAAELRTALESSVQLAPLEVRVRFDEIQLPSRRLAELRPGDVLSLDMPLDSPLTVEVAGVPRFLATAGTKGKRVACLVTDTTGEVDNP